MGLFGLTYPGMRLELAMVCEVDVVPQLYRGTLGCGLNLDSGVAGTDVGATGTQLAEYQLWPSGSSTVPLSCVRDSS
jgi:hypothetical protein